MQNKINNIKNSLLELKPIFGIDYTLYFSEKDKTFVVLLDAKSTITYKIESMLDKSITNFYSLFPEFMYTIEFQDSNSFKDITNLNNFVYNSDFAYIQQETKLILNLPIVEVDYNNQNAIDTINLFSKFSELEQNYKKTIYNNYIKTEDINVKIENDTSSVTIVSKLESNNKLSLDIYNRNSSIFPKIYKKVI